MAKKKLRVTGDVTGAAFEDGDLNDTAVLTLKGTKVKPKVTVTFDTDHPSDTHVGIFTVLKAKGKVTWKYDLDNDDLRVQNLAAGEQIHETYTLRISAKGFKPVNKIVTVTINGADEAANNPPVITSDGGGDLASINVSENSTAVTTVTATDLDPGAVLTYQIIGGFDNALFSINSSTGALTFLTGHTVGAPADSDGNGVYEVMVNVSDGTDTDSQAISVTVTMPPVAVDTITLPASQGLVIYGDQFGDRLGRSTSFAGDINGDGFTDILVGAPENDSGGSYAGAAYVIFGTDSAFAPPDGEGRAVIDAGSLGAGGFVIEGGGADARFGWSIASAGDVNGDGFDDIVLSTPFVGDGEAYLIYGKAGGFGPINVDTLAPDAGVVIEGAPSHSSGRTISSAGDVNGDGFDDIVISSANTSFDFGMAYIVFGGDSLGTPDGGRTVLDLDGLPTGDGFLVRSSFGDEPRQLNVSSAGDINGDGFDDLVLGSPLYGYVGYGLGLRGETYVIFGKSGTFGSPSGPSDQVDVSGGFAESIGFVIRGTSSSEQSGYSVSGAGDINGDGFDDLLVGALSGGNAYVIFGKAGGFGIESGGRHVVDLATLAPIDGFVVSGDQSGRSIHAAGDVNGDGFADFIVGAPTNDENGYDAGAAWVVFGHSGSFGSLVGARAVLDLDNLPGNLGFMITGDNAYDRAGTSVSGGGDVNGDGFDDVIVGAIYGNHSGTVTGEAYVVYGAAFGASTDPVNTSGGAGNEMLIGALGDDNLSGGGGLDVFHGGKGDDTLTAPDLNFRLADGGNGDDTLVLTGSGATFDFTTLANTKVQSIEAIDFAGSGDNTLTLGYLDAIGLSDFANTDFTGSVAAPKAIVIDADAGDVLQLASDPRGAWALQANDIGLDGSGTGYDVYSFDVGGAHLVKIAITDGVTVQI